MKYITLFILLMLMSSQSVFANKCTELVQKASYYEASDVCRAMAGKGEKNAQFALAVMYYQGNGVMSDVAQAQAWMRKAAMQNHRQAQYNLGIMIANGQGSSTDLVEAYAWLKIAADNGYSAAADSLKQLAEELSSSEKKQANDKLDAIKKELKN